MKTNEIYKKGIEEFNKKFVGDLTMVNGGGENNLYKILQPLIIRNYIKTLTLDILKGEIKRLEEEKCNVPPQPKNTKNVDELLKYAGRFNFNKALQDQIDYYQEQVKLIDE